jgi:hypothetical protein
MKRLAWLLLAVFCAALVQVQPAQAAPARAPTCACCHATGACGAPHCLPPSAFASLAFATEPSLRLKQEPAPCASPLPRVAPARSASPLPPGAIRPRLSAAPWTIAATGVPLFKAHCCFLI